MELPRKKLEDNKEVLMFTNWEPGQPDNYRGNENYGIHMVFWYAGIHMVFWYAEKWNDAPAAYGVSYILCEL